MPGRNALHSACTYIVLWSEKFSRKQTDTNRKKPITATTTAPTRKRHTEKTKKKKKTNYQYYHMNIFPWSVEVYAANFYFSLYLFMVRCSSVSFFHYFYLCLHFRFFVRAVAAQSPRLLIILLHTIVFVFIHGISPCTNLCECTNKQCENEIQSRPIFPLRLFCCDRQL